MEMQIEFTMPAAKFFPSDKMHKEALRLLHQYLKGGSLIYHGAVIKHTPHAFGFLRNSIQPIVRPVMDGWEAGAVTSCPYAMPIEYGAGEQHIGPGGPRRNWWVSKMGMVGLKLWAMQKLGDSGWAYYIRLKIAGKIPGKKGGLKPRLMFHLGFNQVQMQLQSIMDECHDKIVERWAVA